MDGLKHNFEIFQCDTCHSLLNIELSRSIDSLFEPMSCPDCKSHMTKLGSQPDAQEHYCPECHEPIMAMSIIRYWG